MSACRLALCLLGLTVSCFGGNIRPASPCACNGGDFPVGGVVESPNYPSPYCANLQSCVYRLQASAGHRVKVIFTKFNTEKTQDVLTVYDSDKADDDEVILARLSGTVAAGTTLYSGGQEMTLSFSTDNGQQLSGWSLTFMSVTDNGCGDKQALSGDSAIIQTPNYPYNYPDNINCNWTYSAPQGQNAMVSFAAGASTELGQDFVDVREDGVNLAVYSGNSGFKTVMGTDGNLQVLFSSDASIVKSGIRANFSHYAPPQNCLCGQAERKLTAPDQVGVLTSPNFGGPNSEYCHNANCVWYLEVPDQYKVRVTFNTFSLENFYDNLYIQDNIGGAQLEHCTGNSCQPRTSSVNKITIVFRTDTSVASKGFSLNWTPVL